MNLLILVSFGIGPKVTAIFRFYIGFGSKPQKQFWSLTTKIKETLKKLKLILSTSRIKQINSKLLTLNNSSFNFALLLIIELISLERSHSSLSSMTTPISRTRAHSDRFSYRISSYSFLPWIVSSPWIDSSSNEETIQVFIT